VATCIFFLFEDEAVLLAEQRWYDCAETFVRVEFSRDCTCEFILNRFKVAGQDEDAVLARYLFYERTNCVVDNLIILDSRKVIRPITRHSSCVCQRFDLRSEGVYSISRKLIEEAIGYVLLNSCLPPSIFSRAL